MRRIQSKNQNPFSEQKVEKSEDDRAPVPDQSVHPDSQLPRIRPRGDAQPADPARGHRRGLAVVVQHLAAGVHSRSDDCPRVRWLLEPAIW